MKNVKLSFIICSFLFATMPSCVKNTGSTQNVGNPNGSALTLSKDVVMKGEPLLASAEKPEVNAVVKWKIYPATNAVILPSDAKAVIFTTNPGTHQVTANYYSPSDTTIAYDSSVSTITVIDSTYTPPPVAAGYDTTSISGDQITLIPTASLDSGLVILAKTTRLYNCFPYITAYAWAQGGNTQSLDFDFGAAEIVEGKIDCGGAKDQAYAYMPINTLTNGVYTVTANLNHVSYQGSLTVTDTDYTFTWNYTSGVIISPMNIKRN